MKRKNLASCLFAVFLAMLWPALNAFSQADPADPAWELGPEIYYYHYEEPDFAQNEGVMYGATGAYTYRQDWVLRLEGRGALGVVDYSSSGTGTEDDIQDYTFEGRALAGRDWNCHNIRWTPFVGMAYRHLYDGFTGHVTTTGHAGYDRRSHYFYSPVGLDISTSINTEWQLGARIEYDIFWQGKQESDLSEAVSSLNDLENDQESGYGLRASIDFRKKGPTYDIAIGPFVRYWSIDDSEHADLTRNGALIGFGLEPANETLEAGGQATFRF